MIANWIKESVNSAPGTGTISLGGAETGFVSFADHFASTTIVTYLAEDGDDKEVGVGTFTTGTPDTLSRTTIIETLVSGTFDNTSPSAIDLSASSLISIAPVSQNLLGSGTPNRKLNNTTNYMDGPDTWPGYAASVAAILTDREFSTPFWLWTPRNISTLVFHVDTADGTTTNARMGIRLPDPANENAPGDLLIDWGDLSSLVGTTGKKTASGSVYLPPGMYFACWATDSSTLQILGPVIGNCLGVNHRKIDNGSTAMYRSDGVTGALPSTYGGVNSQVTGNPWGIGWQ